MSETKHTPGPWGMRLSDNATPFIHHGKDALLYDIDDPDHLVCVMPAEITRGFNSFANARLIAAAPELLEASEAIIERWDSTQWTWAEHTSVLIHRLRAAIAKAKGERP
jgi:hypothetical protein